MDQIYDLAPTHTSTQCDVRIYTVLTWVKSGRYSIVIMEEYVCMCYFCDIIIIVHWNTASQL